MLTIIPPRLLAGGRMAAQERRGSASRHHILRGARPVECLLRRLEQAVPLKALAHATCARLRSALRCAFE